MEGFRMKRPLNNADMFAERGDPWSGDLPRPLSRPEGVPSRLTGKAWKWMILKDHRPETLAKADTKAIDDPVLKGNDGDRLFAPHCLPISLRLAKERNKVLPSMSGLPEFSEFPESRGMSSSAERALINRRAKINSKGTQRLVKVK